MEEIPNEEKKEEINNIPQISHSSKKLTLTKKVRENPWILSTFVLGVIFLILLIGNFTGMTGNAISSGTAGDKIINYLDQLVDGEINLVDVKPESSMYEVTVEYEGKEIPVYVTTDGKYYTTNLMPLTTEIKSSSTTTQEIPKSDKPKAELFVMTHCPYGTQAEKGIFPVIKTLENTADVKIRFVHYFMHEPEETETPRQVCIREEQPDKYLDYLECFLEDGDSERCLTQAGIDKTAMETCISSGKAEEYYKEDSKLSENYGVQGSPTLIINGQKASSGRDSASYLDAICKVFNNAPESCGTELSSSSPSPGFGWSGTGSSTSAQC